MRAIDLETHSAARAIASAAWILWLGMLSSCQYYSSSPEPSLCLPGRLVEPDVKRPNPSDLDELDVETRHPAGSEPSDPSTAFCFQLSELEPLSIAPPADAGGTGGVGNR